MDAGSEAHLSGMLRYVTGRGCRRAALACHFGEAPPACHGMCDSCRDGATNAQQQQQQQHRDVTEEAGGALATLQAWPGAEKRATLTQLVDKWRGSKARGRGGEGTGAGSPRALLLAGTAPPCIHSAISPSLLPPLPSPTDSPTHPPTHPPMHQQDKRVAAAAKALSRDECELVVQELLVARALRLDFGFTAYATNVYLRAAATAAAVQAGQRRVFIAPPTPPGGGAAGGPGGQEGKQQEEQAQGQQQANGQQKRQRRGSEQPPKRPKQQQQQEEQVVDLVGGGSSDSDDRFQCG